MIKAEYVNLNEKLVSINQTAIFSDPTNVSRVLKNDGTLASENDGKTQGSAARINFNGFF